MGERRGWGKKRNTNGGLMGMDNGGGLTVGVGTDGAGVSNGEKKRQLKLNSNKKKERNHSIPIDPGKSDN